MHIRYNSRIGSFKMKKILISSAFGAGNSCLKSLTLENKRMDPEIGTCHDAWDKHTTSAGDYIGVCHLYDINVINAKETSDINVCLQINNKNLIQICQRIVVLDFLYATNKSWTTYDGAWNIKKHATLAGPNWPAFSTNINDYPVFCLDEICETAYHRCKNWIYPNNDFTFQVDSDELFGDSKPTTIQQMLDAIGCTFDQDFLDKWKNKQKQTFLKYKDLFTWSPGAISYMEPIIVSQPH